MEVVNDRDRPADDNASAEENTDITDDIPIPRDASVESDDCHRCGRCRLDFTSLVEFIKHKLKHDDCKVAYKRVSKRNVLPHLVKKEPKPTPDKASVARKRKRHETDIVLEKNILSETLYTCDKCPRQYRRVAALKRHQDHDHSYGKEADEVNEGEIEEESEDDNNDEDYKVVGEDSGKAKAKKVAKAVKEPEASPLDEDRPLTCETCSMTFKEENALRVHMLRHSDWRGYPCQVGGCPFAFKTKGSLKRHMRRHTDERPYKCDLCGRCFRESGALTRHQKSRTPCTEKGDSDFPRYGKKLEIVLGDPSETNIDSNKEDGVMNVAGGGISEGSNMSVDYHCKNNSCVDLTIPPEVHLEDLRVCMADMGDEKSLRDHLDEHLAGAPLRCGLCSFATASHNLLNAHMANHQSDGVVVETTENQGLPELSETDPEQEQITKDASTAVEQLLALSKKKSILNPPVQVPTVTKRVSTYSCQQCGRVFNTRDSLQKHMDSHSEDRHFKCGECGKLFKRIGHVREHLRIHSNDRPFNCSICMKKFKTQNAVKVHERTHTDTAPWHCNHCTRTFREKASLIRHIRTHTGEKPYPCPKCGRMFAEHGTLNRHLKCKVPCTQQTRSVAEQELSLNEDGVSVLAEFSSVVTDTQQYIPEGQTTILDVNNQEYVLESNNMKPDEAPSEYVVVDSVGQTLPVQNVDVMGSSVPYVIVTQSDNSYTLVRFSQQTGETISIEGLTNQDEVAEALKAVAMLKPGEEMVEDQITAVAMVPESDINETIVTEEIADIVAVQEQE